MTIDLDELERLEKAATPGLWFVTVAQSDTDDTADIKAEDGDDFPWEIAQTFGDAGMDGETAAGNAALIVAMRNALPELIALAREALEARDAPAPPSADAQEPVAFRWRMTKGDHWSTPGPINMLPSYMSDGRQIEYLYASPLNARAAALEEAARYMESRADEMIVEGGTSNIATMMARIYRDEASAIRALAALGDDAA